ncbi:OmpA family protein [Arboricoccus pini]|uniref:OmpA family protein n=1 Tax=Arboricoccus pini TaxID=1963835 RepID=A0A212QQ43_9PROT|nr:OmpA family protein [Arboricoccus pini]SNB61604.1 OmpA family protein [Arboricoccus pini]
MRVIQKLLLGSALAVVLAPAAMAQDTASTTNFTQQGNQVEAAQTAPGEYYVFFDFDRATVRPDARSVIAQAANDWKNNGNATINIVGHADRSGSPAYNQRLSERRAAAVQSVLETSGVPTANILSSGVGESQPMIPTADGVREPKNRFVSIAFPAQPPAPPPVAEEPAAPVVAPKKWELEVGGLYTFIGREEDGHNTGSAAGGEITLGYRPKPGLRFRISQSLEQSYSVDNSGLLGRSVAGIDAIGAWGRVQPYAGWNIGGTYGNGVQDGGITGPEIGLRVSVSQNVYLYTKAAYDYNWRNPITKGETNAGAGVGFRF